MPRIKVRNGWRFSSSEAPEVTPSILETGLDAVPSRLWNRSGRGRGLRPGRKMVKV